MKELAPYMSCIISIPSESGDDEFQAALDAGYSKIYMITPNGLFLHNKLQPGRDGKPRYVRQPIKEIPTLKVEPISAGIEFLPDGKIPMKLLREIEMFFSKVIEVKKTKTEAMTFIMWNPERGYFVHIPKQKVSGASVEYDRADLPPDSSIIVDIHSHADFNAFFSGTDDRDDATKIGYSGVIGHNASPQRSYAWRFNNLGQKIEIKVTDIFHEPVAETVIPDEWIEQVSSYSYQYVPGQYSGQHGPYTGYMPGRYNGSHQGHGGLPANREIGGPRSFNNGQVGSHPGQNSGQNSGTSDNTQGHSKKNNPQGEDGVPKLSLVKSSDGKETINGRTIVRNQDGSITVSGPSKISETTSKSKAVEAPVTTSAGGTTTRLSTEDLQEMDGFEGWPASQGQYDGQGSLWDRLGEAFVRNPEGSDPLSRMHARAQQEDLVGGSLETSEDEAYSIRMISQGEPDDVEVTLTAEHGLTVTIPPQDIPGDFDSIACSHGVEVAKASAVIDAVSIKLLDSGEPLRRTVEDFFTLVPEEEKLALFRTIYGSLPDAAKESLATTGF